jgi:signal transduction histidine kinase
VYPLLVLALVLPFVWWHTASLERAREDLERKVAEQTSELQRQKHQLETYNRELIQTNKQLRRAIEEKSELLGVAAHDLKNPLFGIRALSEIVLENEALSDKGGRKVNLIRESADESLHLIDELLASAAGSAQAQLDAEPVDLGALAQWVVHGFEPQAERKEQRLQCSVAADECVVEGDKRRLREALSNLVSNAVKYSPPGEPIDVFVERASDVVTVAVVDAGPGLSVQDQRRMFAPFQRLTPSPTGGESSSGLGLYIVKQVVELHEGQVTVESALGEGSTFTLSFPAVEVDADAVPEVSPPDVESPPADDGQAQEQLEEDHA